MCGIIIEIEDNNGSKQKLLDSLTTQKNYLLDASSGVSNKRIKIIDKLIETINSDDSIDKITFEVPLPTRR